MGINFIIDLFKKNCRRQRFSDIFASVQILTKKTLKRLNINMKKLKNPSFNIFNGPITIMEIHLFFTRNELLSCPCPKFLANLVIEFHIVCKVESGLAFSTSLHTLRKLRPASFLRSRRVQLPEP